MSRVVDPTKFMLLGAVTDWLTVYRRQIDHAPTPKEIAAQRKLERLRIVQLRWLIAPALGYPTEPFRVWRRPAMPMQVEVPVNYTQTNLFTLRFIVLERPMVFVRLQLNASAPGSLLAFAGMPYASPLVATRSLAAGFSNVTVSGAAVQALIVSPGTTVQQITGLDHQAADDKSWELVEIVGLPVGPAWNGVLDLDRPQGLVGALGDPRDAALDRYRRGAPFYGWEPTIPSGGNAPSWKLADPKAMLKVMDQSVLPPLLDMVKTGAPQDHAVYEVQHTLSPVAPLNPAQPGDDANASFRPMCNLVFGASTDPLASLVTGFGTAFEDIDIPPVVLADRKLFGDPGRSDWDFMVTARYRRGADHGSEEIEYAAIVFAPAVGTAPPVPAQIAAELDGLRAPAATDEDWRAIQRVTWDKLADGLPFRVGSYAFARQPLAPAGTVVPLMGARPYDDALQPISATTSPEQAELGRLQGLDETYGVQGAPAPNVLLYALAHQDLFGLWSAWASRSAAVGEPPVQAVTLLAARLEPQAAGTGASCPTTLVIEFSWDWANRSPRRLEFAGRLYGQTKLGDPPPAGPLPTGLQTALSGGPGAVLQVVFNGAAGAAVLTGAAGLSAQLQYLSFDGKTLLGAPVVASGPRRYRLTLTGSSLNFDAAARIGLAIWARGTEERTPNRVGDWSLQPLIASTADPRPPVIMIEHEDVLMASIADANGEHHARLEWPSASGAAGYFVYTTTEIKLRADRGMPDPARSLTLSQRLAELRAVFAADPSRRSWTRVNAQPVTGTSMQVTLPRGSKEIHAYMVLGLSAGQVESAWPGPGTETGKRPICYAAPQLVRPAPPDIEVARVLDRSVSPPAWRASLRVRTKPGVPVARVDLHRVRVPEAAVELDSMGPPLMQLSGTQAPFTVQPTVAAAPGESQAIGTITGLDPVEGSWRRVFYRATAWGTDDAARGLYGARSAASALREVVVPPATPPDLAPLTWHWPGGGLGDAQIDGSTLAPLGETPLGFHRLRADALAEHADGTSEVLWRFPASSADDDRLQSLQTAAPGAGLNGLWRSADASGATALHLLMRRAAVEDALKVRWLLTDPLGRATERTLSVPAGSPLPAPDLLSPAITKRVNVGFIVTFQTSVPVAPTAAGPYKLRVRYTPAKPSPFPQFGRAALPPIVEFETLLVPRPPAVHNAADALRLPPVRPPIGPLPHVHSLELALADIPPAVTGEDLFANSVLIPVRRSRAPNRRTALAVGLRGSGGRVELAILAPDGRSASVRLDLV
jgi:hypothetical protein